MINLNIFKRFDRTFWTIFAYEAAFFTIAFLLFLGWNYVLNAYAAKLTSLESMTFSQAGQAVSSLQSFVAVIIISSIVMVVLQFMNWVLFENIIWDRLTGKKFSSQRLKDFSIHNLLVIPIYLVVLTIFAFVVLKNSIPITSSLMAFNKIIGAVVSSIFWAFLIFPATLYVLGMHNSIYLGFYRTGKILGSIGAGFKAAFSIRHYQNYLIMGITFAIISMLLTLFSGIKGAYTVLSMALLVLLAAWLKVYTAQSQIGFIKAGLTKQRRKG